MKTLISYNLADKQIMGQLSLANLCFIRCIGMENKLTKEMNLIILKITINFGNSIKIGNSFIKILPNMNRFRFRMMMCKGR